MLETDIEAMTVGETEFRDRFAIMFLHDVEIGRVINRVREISFRGDIFEKKIFSLRRLVVLECCKIQMNVKGGDSDEVGVRTFCSTGRHQPVFIPNKVIDNVTRLESLIPISRVT